MLLADKVVNAPLPATVFPIDPGEENVDPPIDAALIELLQENPEPETYDSADVAPVQFGTDNADGDAGNAEIFPRTLFDEIAASDPDEIFPHVGALDGPLDDITCPLVEPEGFINCGGSFVWEEARVDIMHNNRNDIFFIFKIQLNLGISMYLDDSHLCL